MAYPYTLKLRSPLNTYHIDRGFLRDSKYRETTKGKWIYWGLHLGEDYNQPEGAAVCSIGKGRVVYSKLHPGIDSGRRNWGNIIIIAHKNPQSKEVFYSLYGHLKERLVEKGDKVEINQKIGEIAPANTKENGWWGKSHLHFAIYLGQWKNQVLPGYYEKNQNRTILKDWAKPNRFIREYNRKILYK